MKCIKCGFENSNEAEWCANCGTKKQEEQSKGKKKINKKRIIIASAVLLTVVLLITILIVVLSKLSKFEDPFPSVDDIVVKEPINITHEYEDVVIVDETLKQEFAENKITADDYIMQLAYSIYEPDKLDSKYKDLELGTPNTIELFRQAGKLAESLSKETSKYIFGKYMLADVKWDVEDDDNTLSGNGKSYNNYKITPVVNDKYNLSKLDKAVLSPKGNFIIYYTTSGVNAINDNDANKMAAFLEEVVDSYEKKYGLKFEYSPRLQGNFLGTITEAVSFNAFQQATSKAKKVLEKSNIDTKYIDTAMPIYIIDTDIENTNALAYYMPDTSIINGFTKVIMNFWDIFEEHGADIDGMLTAYAVPYFVVNSSIDNFDNVKIALSHELFHHYQAYICGDGTYSECASGLFTTETTANLAAAQNINIDTTKTVLNGHAANYILDVSTSIDKAGQEGYSAFAFANNYDEVVKDGHKHLFQSMKYENPLHYIYDKSDGNYKKAMLLTAQRNLTLDYENKLYTAQTAKQTYYPENYRDIGIVDNSINLSIDYSSMQYFYIDASKLNNEETQITFNGDSDELSVLLFVNEGGSYKYLYTHTLNKDFVIDLYDFYLYDEVAFCVVNSSVKDNMDYYIEVKENGTKQPTVNAESLNLNTIESLTKDKSSLMFYQVSEAEESVECIVQVKLGFDNNSLLNEAYIKATCRIKNKDTISKIAFTIGKNLVKVLLSDLQKYLKNEYKYVEFISHDSKEQYDIVCKFKEAYFEKVNELGADLKKEYMKELLQAGFVYDDSSK